MNVELIGLYSEDDEDATADEGTCFWRVSPQSFMEKLSSQDMNVTIFYRMKIVDHLNVCSFSHMSTSGQMLEE